MKLFRILFCIILTFTHFTLQAQIQGVWHSNFQVAGKSLLMDLDVKGIGQDGSIIVSIPDQPKMKPQTMTDFALFSDSLWFSWKAIGLTYCRLAKIELLDNLFVLLNLGSVRTYLFTYLLKIEMVDILGFVVGCVVQWPLVSIELE